MTDPLYTHALFAAAKGDMELDEFGAVSAVLSGQPITRQVPDRLGIQEIHNVTDCNGDTLVAGELYFYRDAYNPNEPKKIRVLREQYGAGNVLDSYQRLFYMDETLEEKMMIIDGRGGFLSPATYPSTLEPVKKKATENEQQETP